MPSRHFNAYLPATNDNNSLQINSQCVTRKNGQFDRKNRRFCPVLRFAKPLSHFLSHLFRITVGHANTQIDNRLKAFKLKTFINIKTVERTFTPFDGFCYLLFISLFSVLEMINPQSATDIFHICQLSFFYVVHFLQLTDCFGTGKQHLYPTYHVENRQQPNMLF